MKLNPKAGLIHFHLGRVFHACEEYDDAVRSFQRAINRLPSFVSAHVKLADVLLEAGAFNAAVVSYRKAIELAPERASVYVDLATALRKCNNDIAAETCYIRALEINPKLVSALNNYGNLLRKHGKHQKARELMLSAVQLSPKNPVFRNGLGLAYEKLQRFSDALKCYEEAIELNPEYAKAHYNLGGLLQETGRFDRAEQCYLKSIECEPEYAESRFRLATLRMLRGDLAGGWKGYEARWNMEEAQGSLVEREHPPWEGESLEGKKVLVWAEQGLGDTFQFVRFTKHLKDSGAYVVFECHPRMISIMSRLPYLDEVVPRRGKVQPKIDFQVAMMSLPGILNTTVETIPCHVPYLFADESRIEQWREKLSHANGLKVGISWQGNPNYYRDGGRSMALREFEHLSSHPEVQLISLQREHQESQGTVFDSEDRLIDFSGEIDSGEQAFEDTAAIIKTLDLVITTDSAIAHLAGGLGAPVWVILGPVPEWRWLLEREDSPWYPTMRLFRAREYASWETVMKEIAQELEIFLRSKEETE